jgi:hypothetical protein
MSQDRKVLGGREMQVYGLMKNFTLLVFYSILIVSVLHGDITIGADAVSRYVWRGADYGNAAAIQPFVKKSIGSVTIGAWGSFSLTDPTGTSESGGNECDLFLSTTAGPVELTLTDYFFPAYLGEDELSNADNHITELSAGVDISSISVLAATNVSGDDDNSTYLEFYYGVFSLGFGDGLYSTDGKFSPVSIGVSASKDNFSIGYSINPDKDTSFLVFSINLIGD